jgi:hypothetical protein
LDGFWGLGRYKHATPTELLCIGLIPPEAARNGFLSVGGSPGRPTRITLRLWRESRMTLGCIKQRLQMETIYIETTIVSYLVANPSRDLILTAF